MDNKKYAALLPIVDLIAEKNLEHFVHFIDISDNKEKAKTIYSFVLKIIHNSMVNKSCDLSLMVYNDVDEDDIDIKKRSYLYSKVNIAFFEGRHYAASTLSMFIAQHVKNKLTQKGFENNNNRKVAEDCCNLADFYAISANKSSQENDGVYHATADLILYDIVENFEVDNNNNIDIDLQQTIDIVLSWVLEEDL